MACTDGSVWCFNKRSCRIKNLALETSFKHFRLRLITFVVFIYSWARKYSTAEWYERELQMFEKQQQTETREIFIAT